MNFRVSKELKRNFTKAYERVGLSPYEALRVFMAKTVHEGPVLDEYWRPCPLCPSGHTADNPKYRRDILEAMRDAKAGAGLTRTGRAELKNLWARK